MSKKTKKPVVQEVKSDDDIAESSEEDIEELDDDNEIIETEEELKRDQPNADVDSDIEPDEDFQIDYGEEDDADDSKKDNNVKIIKFVDPEKRKTSEIISMKECARAIGDRARHLENGAQPYIDTQNYTNPIEIAYNEYLQKKIPFFIIRQLGRGIAEKWKMSEMTLRKIPSLDRVSASVGV